MLMDHDPKRLTDLGKLFAKYNESWDSVLAEMKEKYIYSEPKEKEEEDTLHNFLAPSPPTKVR